jgi:hypothetical protein
MLLVRGLVLAVLVRGVVALAARITSLSHASIVLHPAAAVGVAAICGWLALLDSARRRDSVLLANLGVGPAAIAGCAAIPSLVLEGAIALSTGR